MALRVPTLAKEFTGTGAVRKLDSNFTAIEDFFFTLVNSLPTLAAPGGNLTLTERAAIPAGIFGTGSFVPVFNMEQDELTISHELPNDVSACVVGKKYHETTSDFFKDLKEIASAEGSYTLIFGVRSRGAPAIEMLVELDDTNTSIELPIWRFDITRVVDTCHIENLRLACQTLITRDLFDTIFHFQHPLSLTYVGALPAENGPLPVGIVAPWDCQVDGAVVRLDTGPAHTSGVAIEFWTGRGTNQFNVLDGAASWGAFESDETIEINPKTPPTLLRKGSYIFPMITGGEGSTDPQAANMSATIMLSRIYHEIR